MDNPSQEIPIKNSPHRGVWLRVDGQGNSTVVKRFHSKGRWRRLGDRSRARGEYRMLRKLTELGLRVPTPLHCRRTHGAWELTLETIPGAHNLSHFLSPLGRQNLSSTSLDPAACARQLGALLGKAHGLGLDHGDLHGGNLLLDETGQAWLVDVPKSRLRSNLSVECIERELAALDADSREFVPKALRRHFWLAWLRAFRSTAGSLPAHPKALAKRITAASILQRREALLKHAQRWLRVSGLCERRNYQGRQVLSAKHELAQAWFAGDCIPAVFDQGHPMVEPSWQTVGRAWQHGLPSLIPLFIQRGPEPLAAYLLPEQARELGFDLAQDPAPLPAALSFRGLALSANSQSVPSKEHRALVGPGCRLIFTEGLPNG